MWYFMNKSRYIRQRNIYTRIQDSLGIVRLYFLRVKESKTDNKYSAFADMKTVEQGFLLSVMGTKIKKKAKEDLQWFKSSLVNVCHC